MYENGIMYTVNDDGTLSNTMFIVNGDGTMDIYEPYASIAFNTKEDFEIAKEILEKGLNNKETCKWECDKTVDFYYRCGCEAVWYQEEVPLEWKYCPHCGKEIEIV